MTELLSRIGNPAPLVVARCEPGRWRKDAPNRGTKYNFEGTFRPAGFQPFTVPVFDKTIRWDKNRRFTLLTNYPGGGCPPVSGAELAKKLDAAFPFPPKVEKEVEEKNCEEDEDLEPWDEELDLPGISMPLGPRPE